MGKPIPKIRRLMDVINLAYPDGMIGLYYSDPDRDHGDGLAQFIVSEIRATFNGDHSWEEQLLEARHVMTRVREEAEILIAAICEELDKIPTNTVETDGATYVRCKKCLAYVIEGEFQAHALHHK